MRHEDHVGVGAGRDGGDRPARARREQVGHIPGPFGQIRAPHVLQPPDPAAPPARGPVPALGEDDQRAALVQPPGQPRDLLGEDVLAGLARLDPHVRQPVAHDVHAGVELQGGLHHHPRPPVVDAEQLVHQQERITRPGVPAEHDDRAGQPGGLLGRGEFRFVHDDLHPEGLRGRSVEPADEPPHDPVVAGLVRLGAQPAAEPAGDPQAETHEQRRRLRGQPDQREVQQPQYPHPARPRPAHRPERQDHQGEQRKQHDERHRDEDHQRRQHEPADQAGWEHGRLPS